MEEKGRKPMPMGFRGLSRAMLTLAPAVVAASLLAQAAAADPVEDFYKGRTLSIYIGYTAGGGYDAYARVLARHLADHLPGHPTIVPQNMPGAGSLRAVNYLYNIAPKDGSAIATFARGMAMEPLFDPTGTQYDAQKLTWIGSISDEVSICGFRAEAGVKSFDDMLHKTLTVGGTGPGADTDIFAVMVNNLLDTHLKIATGYPGSNEIDLAVERGELDGRCGWSWSSLLAHRKYLLDQKKINVVLQLSLAKHEDLPNVPLVIDETKDPKKIAAMKLILSRNVMARPFAAPPGIPADRKEALRAAFDATMKDPAFLAETQKQDLEVRPVSGAKLEQLVAEIYASPPEVIELAKAAVKE
jgi:tripartite-type tricarboxylate transporter receptor subunit TctC